MRSGEDHLARIWKPAIATLVVALAAWSPAQAQTCSPTQTSQTAILPQPPATPKPALGATFVDTLYGTCFRRISDDQLYPTSTHNPVPLYSQLQAWNADQSLIFLANGDLLRSPSYSYYKRVATGGANFRWSPVYPNIGYFSRSNRFEKMDVNTDVITTLHTFNEYPGGLEHGNEWEDLSNDSRFVVLEGYRTSDQRDTVQVSGISMTSGSRTITSAGRFGEILVRMPVYGPGIPNGTTVQTVSSSSSLILSQSCTLTSSNALLVFGASEVFVYDILNDRKGTTRPGYSGLGLCSGIDDMLMSPSGKYALLHWGTGGVGQTCHLQAYDTSMVWVGQVSCGRGHFDLTVDKDGSEWAVTFTTNAGCGETGAYLAKYKIPDGYTRMAAGDSSGFARLAIWSDLIGGGHVSGRGFGSGFVVASADHFDQTSPVAFYKELVKVYLDSRPEAPHLERLANHRSDQGQVYNDASCPLSSYWAQAHATVSRDGTRVLWGSNWNMVGPNCAAEAYIMDLAPASPDNTPPGKIRDLRSP